MGTDEISFSFSFLFLGTLNPARGGGQLLLQPEWRL
jgi:hypothetical protein